MKDFFRGKVAIAVLTLAGPAFASQAFAYTECLVTPTSIFSGDEGTLWMVFSNGGSATLGASDPDFKQTFALGVAAVMGDKNLRVRYPVDGLACNSSANPIMGLWLEK